MRTLSTTSTYSIRVRRLTGEVVSNTGTWDDMAGALEALRTEEHFNRIADSVVEIVETKTVVIESATPHAAVDAAHIMHTSANTLPAYLDAALSAFQVRGL